MRSPRRHLLLGVSGGIAAYKTPDLVRRLRERGLDVRVALTQAALSFVAPLALEVVTGHAVWGDDYLEAGGTGVEEHVAAADWADAILFAPATTHLLARLALGLGDDFLTTTALVFDGSVLAAPAMHPRMWSRETTRAHVETLEARGVRFLGPDEGPLASGEHGVGRMMDTGLLAEAVAFAMAGPWQGRQVVVSAGPTHEPLDPVRFLGNRSSGKMGFALAREAALRGADVTLVAGPVSLLTPAGVRRVDVETALEMQAAVRQATEGADLVVMAAAVADFRPAERQRAKRKRSQGAPELRLVENPDILAELGRAAGDGTILVGFAAETDDLEAHAEEKLERKGCHFLVANDVSRADIGFGSDDNEVVVFRRDGEPIRMQRQSKAELAGKLLDLFGERWEAEGPQG